MLALGLILQQVIRRGGSTLARDTCGRSHVLHVDPGTNQEAEDEARVDIAFGEHATVEKAKENLGALSAIVLAPSSTLVGLPGSSASAAWSLDLSRLPFRAHTATRSLALKAWQEEHVGIHAADVPAAPPPDRGRPTTTEAVVPPSRHVHLQSKGAEVAAHEEAV